ncbi:MAG: GTP pyrophosphokinase [bacterium]|nr:MAG: GTP pyrophosphokinase [bacterium]
MTVRTKIVHLESTIEAIREYKPDAKVDQILAAYAFSSRSHKGQTRRSGAPYLSHPMAVAHILTRLKMDTTAIAAALLHDTLEDTDATLKELELAFGPEVAKLVDGLTKLSRIRFSSREESQAENMRKMILAMSDDIRIVLIKLADRLHNLRTLEFLKPERQKKIAEESMDIYAPLADRLGIGWLKEEMQNISFKYLHPLAYKKLEGVMKERQEELGKFAVAVCGHTQELLIKERLTAHVTARPKQLFSIYRKMEKQNLEFDQIFDIIGVRIITNSALDCYKALGLLHTTWKPVPGKFKDYIALQKKNMYQSIHTTLLHNSGKFVEFQVRTQQMHMNAEEGIAAHWRYKEGDASQNNGDDKFIWLRRLLDLGQSIGDSKEYLENIKLDLFPDEVYVFTPDQEVKAFPSGATPIDFAYAVHTQVGNHCVGALVNGIMVPLEYRLHNGDMVKIITDQKHHPDPDWMKIAKTSTAKSKIRAYTRTAQKAEALKLGREILEEEVKKHGLRPEIFITKNSLEQASATLGFKSSELAVQRIGFSQLSVDQFLQKLLPLNEWKKIEAARSKSLKNRIFRFFWPWAAKNTGVRVGDSDKILIRLAGCCKPVPGDSIHGFVSRGHGLVIHQKLCPVLKELGPARERIIKAQWEKMKKKRTHPVRIKAYCLNKPGILATVSAAIASCRSNISNAIVTPTGRTGGELDLTIEIEDVNHLIKTMNAVKKVKGVKKVERFMEGVRISSKK